jgi:hypothetical protein
LVITPAGLSLGWHKVKDMVTVPRSVNSIAGLERITGLPDQAGTEETVEFLGYEFSATDYGEACRNLREFFAVVQHWADNEEKNQEKT